MVLKISGFRTLYWCYNFKVTIDNYAFRFNLGWKSFWEVGLTTKIHQRYGHFFFSAPVVFPYCSIMHVSGRFNTFQEDAPFYCTGPLLYRLCNRFLQGRTTGCKVISEINLSLQLKSHVRLKHFSVFSFCFSQMATPIQRS